MTAYKKKEENRFKVLKRGRGREGGRKEGREGGRKREEGSLREGERGEGGTSTGLRGVCITRTPFCVAVAGDEGGEFKGGARGGGGGGARGFESASYENKVRRYCN